MTLRQIAATTALLLLAGACLTACAGESTDDARKTEQQLQPAVADGFNRVASMSACHKARPEPTPTGSPTASGVIRIARGPVTCYTDQAGNTTAGITLAITNTGSQDTYTQASVDFNYQNVHQAGDVRVFAGAVDAALGGTIAPGETRTATITSKPLTGYRAGTDVTAVIRDINPFTIGPQ